MLHFAILAVVLFSTLYFILNKAGEAVAEINNMNIAPVYLGTKVR